MARKMPKNKVAVLEPKKPATPVAALQKQTPKSTKGSSKKTVSSPPSPPLRAMENLSDMEVSDASSDDGDENANEPVHCWPKDDDLKLFKRIGFSCPKDDTMMYSSRIKNLDWDKVKFLNYTADDCKERWLYVQNRLRHYRTLQELLSDAVVWADQPWYNFNKGSKNSIKHPDLPKKPLSSYMLFYMDNRSTVAKEYPGIGLTEMTKLIGKLYSTLSPKKKEKYVEMANKKKAEYEVELAKFVKDNPKYVMPVRQGQTKAKLPLVPTPLKLFCDEKVPKLMEQGLSQTDAKSHCVKTYRELSEKKKMKWITRALKEEANYNEKLEKFKLDNPEVDLTHKKKSILTKDELQIKEKHDGKPEKPPNSGYSLLSKELLASDDMKKIDTKERMSEISRTWKELSEEERNDYNKRALDMRYIYKMKYAAYLETLTHEQRYAELSKITMKGINKRVASTKIEDQSPEKKKKTDSDDSLSDDDFADLKPAKTPTKNSKTAKSPSTSKKGIAKSPTKQPQKKSSSEAELPIWVVIQPLFKGEPPKPLEKLEEFYAAIALNQRDVSPEKCAELWAKCSSKQKKRITMEHREKLAEYSAQLEAFVRKMTKDELKKYKALTMSRQREQDYESGNTSSEEEDDDDDEGKEVESSSEDAVRVLSPSMGVSSSEDEDSN